MVRGFDSFRERFKDYEDCYTIIGGTACDILMNEVGLEFRATKDIDMILLIEERFAEFAAAFWGYIKDGGYKCGWKNSDLPHFYRFTEPQAAGYPVMIELFSRRPDFQIEHPEIGLTPLPVSDEISSLSAIMLDDNYYRLMLEGRKTVDGVSVLGAECLMLFKMKAWLDLRQKKADGAHVNERDLKKHKNDVFRLFPLVEPSAQVTISPVVETDVEQFIRAMRDETIDLGRLGLGGVSLEEILHTVKRIFQT
ncbi:MAG: hypothetical protein HDT33_07040 [Clostridiales bacterium]|nr:hypothetical protein [Clostridiales bacterium]